QLGLAAHNYHDQHQHLPPGIGYYPTPPNEVFGTFFFHLMPYVELDNLFRSTLGVVQLPPPDGPTPIYYPVNNDVYNRRLLVLLCPWDQSVGPAGVVTLKGFPFGATCYSPNALVSGNAALPPRPYKLDPRGRPRTPADITDGTTNTILYAEKYPRCTNTTMAP